MFSVLSSIIKSNPITHSLGPFSVNLIQQHKLQNINNVVTTLNTNPCSYTTVHIADNLVITMQQSCDCLEIRTVNMIGTWLREGLVDHISLPKA